MEICRLPTLWLKALNKHSITHIMYIEIEMLAAIKMYVEKITHDVDKGSSVPMQKMHTHTLMLTPSSFSVYWQSLPLPFLFTDSHSLFLFCVLTVTLSSFSVYWQSLPFNFCFWTVTLSSLFTNIPSLFSVYWQSSPVTFLFTDAHSLSLFCLLMLTPSYFSAAWHTVPQVSAISSTRMATRSLTSPTRTMEATSLAFFLSLWIRAKSTFSRSAMAVTLSTKQVNKYSIKPTHQILKYQFSPKLTHLP